LPSAVGGQGVMARRWPSGTATVNDQCARVNK
jgi:hypothetical protein